MTVLTKRRQLTRQHKTRRIDLAPYLHFSECVVSNLPDVETEELATILADKFPGLKRPKWVAARCLTRLKQTH